MNDKKVNLDSQTQKFIDSLNAKPSTPIYQLSVQDARKLLINLQASTKTDFEDTLQVTIEDQLIDCGLKEKVSISIFKPSNKAGKLPVIMFYHGAGWILGGKETHGRLVKEIVHATGAAAVFINFTLSPEAQYPVAIEQAYAATKYIVENADKINLDVSKLVVAGDSVGGNMTIAVTLLAKERKGPKIAFQVLLYPVTQASMSTGSYEQFAQGPWLTKPAMEWFWNAYEPDVSKRKEILLSPLNATLEQLSGLPKALVITAENDVLRDEGEAYAHKLMKAGIEVEAARCLGTTHDFMLLNGLAKTPPTRLAFMIVTSAIKKLFSQE